MTVTFTPVTANYKRKNMHWERDNRYFYYPSLFVSPFVTGTDCTKNDFQGASLIIADSGGYQLKTGIARKVDWYEILQFQERIADVGLTLDVPPLSKKGRLEYYDKSRYEKCLQQSTINANRMLEHKTNKSMKTYAVIQGKDFDDAYKWFNNITKDHDFDGYAIPIAEIKNVGDIQSFYDQIRLAKEINTDFHFLGNCTQLSMLIYSRLAQITRKNYTFDSSTASNAIRYGQYFEPHYHHRMRFTKNEEHRVKFDLDKRPPCYCPICSKHTVRQLINNPMLTMLHNVYVLKEFNEYSFTVVQDYNEFSWLLKKIVESNSKYQKHSKEIIRLITSLL